MKGDRSAGRVHHLDQTLSLPTECMTPHTPGPMKISPSENSVKNNAICNIDPETGPKLCFIIWVFPKKKNGWFIRVNPIRIDDLGGFPPIFGNIHFMIL